MPLTLRPARPTLSSGGVRRLRGPRTTSSEAPGARATVERVQQPMNEPLKLIGRAGTPVSPVASAARFPGWSTVKNQKWIRERHAELRVHGVEQQLRCFSSPIERLFVMVGWEPGLGWHLSISHPDRYPSWDEIRDARYELLPDACTMGLFLPPRMEYVNVHPNCFHLREVTG